ncbi:MAG: NCS2 family permease [Lachnospirales bacterium]
MNFIENFFKLKERNTTVKTEALAGLTTFLAVAYIIPTNTFLLADTGMPLPAIFVGTIISTIIATLIMGVYANYPVALAPGMGMNAFFAYTVVLYGYGFSWQEGLACVFIAGLLFMLLSLTKIREVVINSIPMDLKYAISAGIGFFITYLGLKNAGIIVSNSATYVALGDLTFPPVALCVFGLLITIFFHVRGNNFAIIIGMFFTTILGLLMGNFGIQNMPTYSSEGSLGDLAAIGDVFGAFLPHIKTVVTSKMGWLAIFTFMFIDFFDTAGTLIAVGGAAGILDKEGNLKDGKKALLSDSLGTIIGSFFGMSPVTSFIESMAGIKVGGRTGLTAVFVSILFALTILAYPLLSVVNGVSVAEYAGATDVVLAPITSPALILVGAMMVTSLRKIDWKNDAITISTFFTILFMVLAFSIAEGIAIGFITYTLIKFAKKEPVNGIMIGLTVLFILRYVFI